MTKKQNKKITFFQFDGIDIVYRNISYVCFLAFLGVIYISNAHSAEKKARKLKLVKEEVKQVRWQFESVNHELIYNSTQSQLAEQLRQQEIGVAENLPKKIKPLRESGKEK